MDKTIEGRVTEKEIKKERKRERERERERESERYVRMKVMKGERKIDGKRLEALFGPLNSRQV